MKSAKIVRKPICAWSITELTLTSPSEINSSCVRMGFAIPFINYRNTLISTSLSL